MRVRVEGRSLELALVKASGELGITQENLDYKIISENKGFIGFGKKIVLEGWIRETRRRSRDRYERVSSSHEESETIKKDIQVFLEGVCSKIVNKKVRVRTICEDDRVIFDIDNDYIASHFLKGAKLAEALEHILRKTSKLLRKDIPFRVCVDAKGSRKAREAELVDIALDLSKKVVESKKPIVLNYKSSYDRKIIHMALDKDDNVYTKSIGTGPNRKLMILPSKEKSNHSDAAKTY